MDFQNKQSRRVLLMATLAFAANFSVWTLYAVMGISIRETLNLTATEFGFLLASPMLTGALLRLPIGILCEIYSCRKLFIGQMAVIIPAILSLPWIDSYTGYILVGFVIGISGVSFTIGIRYVSVWFERRQQGYAMGVFGAGNAGAAITLALAPLIIRFWGWDAIGIFYAIGMSVMVVLFMLMAPEETAYMKKRRKTSLAFHLAPLKELQVWRFGLYYREMEKELQSKEDKFKSQLKELANSNADLDQREAEIKSIRENIDKQLKIVQRKKEELEVANEERIKVLENIAKLSEADAKEQLLLAVKQKAETEAMALVKDTVTQAKADANKEAKKIIIQTIWAVSAAPWRPSVPWGG